MDGLVSAKSESLAKLFGFINTEFLVSLYNNESIDFIKSWVDLGADINIDDNVYGTALNLLVNYKNKEIEEIGDYLLSVGASLDVSGGQPSRVPLVTALWEENSFYVDYLLERGADIEFIDDSTQWRPLMWAVQWGYSKGVEKLIKGGVDVNACDACGTSPLMRNFVRNPYEKASEKDVLKISELLISANADLSIVDDNGDDIFNYIKRYRDTVSSIKEIDSIIVKS